MEFSTYTTVKCFTVVSYDAEIIHSYIQRTGSVGNERARDIASHVSRTLDILGENQPKSPPTGAGRVHVSPAASPLNSHIHLLYLSVEGVKVKLTR